MHALEGPMMMSISGDSTDHHLLKNKNLVVNILYYKLRQT